MTSTIKQIFLAIIHALLAWNYLTAQTLSLNPYQYTVQKTITGRYGAIVTAHPLASQTGLYILKKGGNAFDALIAAQWMLGVVYPWAGTIGGGGFMTARLYHGKIIALDFRETAPASASKNMFIKNGNAQTKLSRNGYIACGVPALVAGLFEVHKYASLPMNELMQPAIDVAYNGFAITAREANNLNRKKADFIKNNKVIPLFVKKNGWKKGDTLIQKDLAQTLSRIQQNGRKEFYEGQTAAYIANAMKYEDGLITKEDLSAYQVKYRTPIVFNYKDYEIISMGLPSSGGLLLNQMMKMVEKRNIGALGFHTAVAVHIMTEVARRAFADRAEYMGDPDFVYVPVKYLTSNKYLEERMNDFNPKHATKSRAIRAAHLTKESEETTHVSVVDKYGNAVSVTTSLNGGYGSGVVIYRTGIIMNNSMDDFSIQKDVPNMFGAVGGDANTIAPNKRMLSSMCPTIVLRHHRPYIILGSPGGTTIPTSIFQVILNIIEFGQSTAEAVRSLRFHHQWLPDRIDVEKRFPQLLQKKLEAMGHTIKVRRGLGRVEAIKIIEDTTKTIEEIPQDTSSNAEGINEEPCSSVIIEAVGDNRGDDDAEGY